MGESDLILLRNDGPVRTLTLNRPERLNAFNQALCTSLTDALLAADADENVRVLIVTGAGRAFSAGTDLYELAETGDFRGGPNHPLGFERMVDALVALRKPLLCAVNGIGVGIGATILGHADLVFMADTARLKCPFTSLALAPEAGASVTFPLLLGRQAATWVLMSSEWIDAEDARTMGIAWKIVPEGDVLNQALDHARRLAVHPLGSLVASKRLIAATFAQTVLEGRIRENDAFDVLLRAPESRAAVAAFTGGREGDPREKTSARTAPGYVVPRTHPNNEEKR